MFNRPHRITLQERSIGKDSFGGQTLIWTTTAVLWASVRPLSGRALETAQQNFGEVSHEVRLNYRDGVTQANRLLFKGRAFEVAAVLNVDEANVELRIMASEGASQG